MWKRETVEANDWNSRDRARQWRAEWTLICNRYLSMERQPDRIDDRSYEEQVSTGYRQNMRAMQQDRSRREEASRRSRSRTERSGC